MMQIHKFLMRKRLILIGLVIVLIGWSVYYSTRTTDPRPVELTGHAVSAAPDFSSITDIAEKKEAFFSYLRPGVAFENQRILQERQQLQRLATRFQQGKLSSKDKTLAAQLAEQYGLALNKGNRLSGEWLNAMLQRVDVLPEALVLTQAANESAWGTSRFATEANNYFGQWCYSPGCGVVPAARGAGMTHEVAKFSSVQESIHRYFMNVNRNAAYRDLRKIRQQLRQNDANLLSVDSALVLSNGLVRYSERGADYVQDVQAMIRHNQVYWVEQ